MAKVSHRHIVFSLPKIIRRNFLYDRKLLGKMSRCAWECLEFFLKASCPGDSMPGAVIAIQTFGDLLSFHSHCDILVSDGCFQRDRENEFTRAPAFDWDKLEELFKKKIFRLLLNEGRITEELIEKLGNWQHSGFHVFCGEPIEPGNESSMENLARYIIRASLSQERMTYIEDEGKVIYQAKDGSGKKEFSALVPARMANTRRVPWMARFRRVNGSRTSAPTSPTPANTWFGTTVNTQMPPGENAENRKQQTRPRQKSTSRWRVKRSSAETGRDSSKKYMR